MPAAENWGEPAYALDVTRSDTLEWLAALVTQGSAGATDTSSSTSCTPPPSPVELRATLGREAAYRRAIQVIRDAVGDDVYLLASWRSGCSVDRRVRRNPSRPRCISATGTTRIGLSHLADRAGPGVADAIATSPDRFLAAVG